MSEATEGTIQNTPADEPTILTQADEPQENGAVQEPAPEGQGDKTAADEAEGKKPEDAKADGAPETYEFKAPDGMELDAALVEAVTPVLKDLNLTNEQAQKLVDFYADHEKARAESQVEAWKTQLATWRDEVKADPEIGGKNYEASVRAAQTVIARFGDDQLKKDLATYRIGNMPSLIRLLAKAGRGMAEDKFHGAGAASGVDNTAPELRFYPSMAPKT